MTLKTRVMAAENSVITGINVILKYVKAKKTAFLIYFDQINAGLVSTFQTFEWNQKIMRDFLCFTPEAHVL